MPDFICTNCGKLLRDANEKWMSKRWVACSKCHKKGTFKKVVSLFDFEQTVDDFVAGIIADNEKNGHLPMDKPKE